MDKKINSPFTRFLRKKGMHPRDFARETGISLNTVNWWCYHNYDPRQSTVMLALQIFPDLPAPRRKK